jgi:toxin ParE1/3/4
MPRPKYTIASKRDLRHIYNYIASDNPDAARNLIMSIRELVRKAAGQPGMGRRRDELVAGMRSIVRGNYVIFYIVDSGELTVVRVLHGAQDIAEDDFH